MPAAETLVVDSTIRAAARVTGTRLGACANRRLRASPAERPTQTPGIASATLVGTFGQGTY